MKTILIVNQKGGVGKTTLCDELAFSFDRTNTKYNLFDMDGQGGLIHDAVQDDNAVVTIIDTPGALQEDMQSWIDTADVILIPVRPSSRDLMPLQTMLDLVKKTSAPVYVVINEYSPTYVASKAFMDWIETECTYPVLCIPRAEVVVQAGMSSKSVFEYAPKHPVCIAFRRVIDTVRRAVGLPAENA